MKVLKAESVYFNRKILDDPCVVVRDGNLSQAIKRLKTRLLASNLLKELRLRERNPGTNDRKREKFKKSIQRCNKLKKKGLIR